MAEESAQVAIVTGAAQGIGRRTAEVLADRGFDLALIDLSECTATLGSLREKGVAATGYQGSVTDVGFLDNVVNDIVERSGAIAAVVNNAGISFIRPAEEIGLEEWRRVLEVNLTGPFLLCQLAGRIMLKQARGSIVNIASVAGLAAVADRAAYNASKHGLIGLTRTLAAEWGGHGVRCNAVCPGWVKTEMDVADQGSGAYSDADIENRVPMGRFASPDDIANAVAFLVDDKQSGFVNGQCLTVDGGWLSDASWESIRLRHRPAK